MVINAQAALALAQQDLDNTLIKAPVNGKLSQFTGKVVEISPATGAEFSVLKADNSTGNFVKIAQRIAVKIEFDQNQADLQRLAPGMSVETRVYFDH